MAKIFQILFVSILLSIIGTTSAHATLIQFDTTPYGPIEFINVGPGNGNVIFNVLSSQFTFNTVTGVGTLESTMTHSDDTWQLTGIFSGVSYINPQSGFDPSGNKELYFDYLAQTAIAPVPWNWFGTPNAPAIVFTDQDLTLNVVNVVGNQDYTGVTDFIGGNMAGYQAWIYWEQFANSPDNSFSLSYWCYTDPNNAHQPLSPQGAPGPGNDWCGDHYWNLENPNAVPEPATMVLMGIGLAGFGFRKRNRK